MSFGPAGLFADLAGSALFLTLILGAAYAIWGRGRAPRPVADGPEDEPYHVYTRAFDLELAATDVPAALPDASPDAEKGWYQQDSILWRACLPRFEALLREQEGWEGASERLGGALGDVPARDIIVAMLIDQSGSMKGARIAWAAVLATRIVALLAELGARSEVLGFSTAGWHGGYACRQWKEEGRPSRPGRLCALMHVVYKSADDEALDEEARNVMLNPALLRENIDGEAILWARDRLAARPEPHKLLILVSDGAPVDDVTLMHNGPSFLYWHVKAVVGEIEARGSPILGAIGIGHRVDAWYPIAELIESPADLAPAGVSLLERLFAAVAR
jgi:cobaltochelatase CobT